MSLATTKTNTTPKIAQAYAKLRRILKNAEIIKIEESNRLHILNYDQFEISDKLIVIRFLQKHRHLVNGMNGAGLISIC